MDLLHASFLQTRRMYKFQVTTFRRASRHAGSPIATRRREKTMRSIVGVFPARVDSTAPIFPGSQTKERKKGKEVWEFRYYEPDARGERQRRAVMVGTREEYSTESAARKSPVVQAILLRLNAEQPSAAGAANFGAVIARYEQEEMPERYSTSAAYQSYSRPKLGRAGPICPWVPSSRWRSRTG